MGMTYMDNPANYNNSDIILYSTEKGDVKVEVLFSNETF